MTVNLRTVHTKDQLTAQFSTLVHQINGKITLCRLIRIWQHCKRYAQHTETNFDAQNYLYCILLLELWP